ncbi:MAG TPA: TonB family protein [Candidatus Angelobacter sp.]|nr:TonB family protein [Candidatus Angelobacter sp.]
MRDPFSRNFYALPSSRDSLLCRICDNFQQLLAPARIFPSSANGAPLHLPRWERSPRSRRAQSASALTHAAIIGMLVWVALHPPGLPPKPHPTGGTIRDVFSLPPRLRDYLRGQNPVGGTGNGSGHDLLLPTQGNLPARSSIQLLKPTLPQNQIHDLPVPPTILDPSAPPVLPPVNEIGIPWMPERNNSSGRGIDHTIGEGTNDSIGDTPGNYAGQGGPRGPYQPGFVLPRCAYCPDPQYTDEAREAKQQGRVTLRVLVSADGRAAQVQITQGVGMGLDERAAETVRTWKFVPARDAARRNVAAWVTIEVVFHLI